MRVKSVNWRKKSLKMLMLMMPRKVLYYFILQLNFSKGNQFLDKLSTYQMSRLRCYLKCFIIMKASSSKLISWPLRNKTRNNNSALLLLRNNYYSNSIRLILSYINRIYLICRDKPHSLEKNYIKLIFYIRLWRQSRVK